MLNLADYKLIIFDLDGTITQPVHDFEQIKKELNLPLTKDILTSIHDLNREDRLRVETALQEIEANLAKQSQLQDGIFDLIEALKSNGIDLAILTRNSRANAITSMRVCKILQFFDQHAIFGRDDAPAKPNPDGIMNLIKYFQVSKNKTLMIGDYKYDLQAGRNAGVKTVYFDPNSDQLWNDLADFRIENYGLKLIISNAIT